MQRTLRIALPFFFLLALPLHAAEAPRGITVDTHADTPTEFLEHPFDLGAWNARGHFDYPRMKAGNLDAEFFAAYVPGSYADKGAAAFCLKNMEPNHQMVEHYLTWVRWADSTAIIRAASHEGQSAIL